MQFPDTFRTSAKAISLVFPFVLFPCAAAAQAEQDNAVRPLEELHVTGVLRERSADELAQSITVIREQTLERITRATLGETLGDQLGVSASFFGAGASRPIIRGLAGTRVRTMEDGVESMDASVVSVDHAVSIDPLIAEQIEIFRGPTTLLYGNGAVGGVVNTITNRIPVYSPADGFEGVFQVSGDSVAESRSGLVALNGGNDRFAWHLDVIGRQSKDYEIPGFADRDAALEHHDEHEGEDHDDEDHEEPIFGIVENSDLDGNTFSLGGSWLHDNGFFGVSVSGFNTKYGLPGHHHHEEEEDHDDEHEHEGDEAVRIDMKQTRFDLKGGWVGLSGVVDAINARLGVSDYEHLEFEGDEVGAQFESDIWDGRLEFMHAPLGNWDGAFGVQLGRRELTVTGDEAFLPPFETSSYGAFVVEQRAFADWRVSVGGRLEYQKQKSSGNSPEVSGSAASLSLEGIRDFGNGYSLAINAALAERLPAAEELYANGLHVATRTVEIGNPGLGVETSRHMDIGLRRSQGDMSWSITAFLTDFADFIYPEDSGEFDDHGEFPIFNYVQRDADFTGVEAEFFTPLFMVGDAELDIRLFADYVRGKLANGAYLPRIPPLRYGSRIQFHNERFLAGLEVTVYDDQDRVAAIETSTEGYTMINADFTWTIETSGGITFDLFVHGRNLGDEDARRHSSLVKDTVPLPGRNLVLGFRSHF